MTGVSVSRRDIAAWRERITHLRRSRSSKTADDLVIGFSLAVRSASVVATSRSVLADGSLVVRAASPRLSCASR
jgi:hypothetical protein